MIIQVQVLIKLKLPNVLDIQCSKIDFVQYNVPLTEWRLIDFIENRYCKMA